MKLIKLLNEQKQAIIYRAVTRGLNPNVPLKPSGIPWLGDIPQHWDIIPNRQLFRETTRKYSGEDTVQLSLSQRQGLVETHRMEERSLKTASFENFKLVVPDDLVLNRFKAHLGVFFASTKCGIVTFHYGVYRPVRKLRTKYFELLYHTKPYCAIYAGVSNGMTVGLQNLSNQNFYKVKSIVPLIEEQDKIIRFSESETAGLNSAIARVEQGIELLREYRTRVVADVVTGKLDVREAAKNLLSEAEAPPMEFEPEEQIEDEVTTDE
jgi:type I restriction enzyme S subunit